VPLAHAYDGSQGKIIITHHAGYLDRLSRWSDIQEYLPYLHEQACSYENVRVLELGARRGNSTMAFLAAAEKADGHVTSVDIVNVIRDPKGMMPWSRSRRWTFIHGDDMDEKIQARLPAQVDVLFLDTSHEYEHTLAELNTYMPRVAPGGIALFHDTRLLGYKCPRENYPAVRLALDDYCEKTGFSWEDIPGKYGLGVIRIDREIAHAAG
jgi:predicted O-methyltransferase YrrM